jgi:hypothetical protein
LFEQNGFFLIEDEATRLRLVRESAKNHAPATLWTTGKAVVLRTSICQFNIANGTFHAELPTGFPLEKVLSIVSARSGIFFNVELPETRLFFQAAFHHYEQGRSVLEFKLPTEAYKVQQRRHPRINTRNSRTIRAFHEDPLQAGRSIQRRVLDLSAGGLSVRLFFGEERHYRVGQKFESLQLHLGRKIISCWAQVRNIRVATLENDKTELVMGLEFLNLDDSGRKSISNLVDQEMIKQFGKLVSKQEKETD